MQAPYPQNETACLVGLWWVAPAAALSTPFDREGTPEDVANTIFFLVSKEGSYINGQTIALDGGWSTTKYVTPEALICERVMPK